MLSTRKPAPMILVVLVALLANGCGGDSDPAAVSQDSKPVKFGVRCSGGMFKYWLIGQDFAGDEDPVLSINGQAVAADYAPDFTAHDNGYSVYWREDVPIGATGTVAWTLAVGDRNVSGTLILPEITEWPTCNGLPDQGTVTAANGEYSLVWSSEDAQACELTVRAASTILYQDCPEGSSLAVTAASVPAEATSLQLNLGVFSGDWPSPDLDEAIWTAVTGPVVGTLGSGWAYAADWAHGTWYFD